MNSTRITALLSGLGLLATWIASVPQSSMAPVTARGRASETPPAARREVPLPILHVDTHRLRQETRDSAAYERPTRNPFEFVVRASSASAANGRVAPVARPAPAVAELPPPPFSLAGIAEETGGSGPARTAVLAGSRDIYLVREADIVDGRYKVMKIGADAIELAPVAGGEPLILHLK